MKRIASIVLLLTVTIWTVASLAATVGTQTWTVQTRRDTGANWQKYNPILAQGEDAYKLDGNPLRAVGKKVGDGVTPWLSLPWFNNISSGRIVATATSVAWVDVTGKPSTLTDYGISPSDPLLTGGTGGGPAFRCMSTATQVGHNYWRLTMNANNGNASYVGMTEMQLRGVVGGPNLVTSATITASGSVFGVPTNVFDGNTATEWDAGAGSPQWIQIYSPIAFSVAEWVITPNGYDMTRMPRDMVLSYSDNGSTWTSYDTRIGVTGWVSSVPQVFDLPTWSGTDKVCTTTIGGSMGIQGGSVRMVGGVPTLVIPQYTAQNLPGLAPVALTGKYKDLDMTGGINAGDISSGTLNSARLPASGVTAGTYTNPTVTYDVTGRATSVSNGTGGSMTGAQIVTALHTAYPTLAFMLNDTSATGTPSTATQTDITAMEAAGLPAANIKRLPPAGQSITLGSASAAFAAADLSVSGGVYAPSAPVSVSVSPGDSSATVSWSPGTVDSTHSAATSYRVDCSHAGDPGITVNPATSPQTVTGMTNGATYLCQVGAINAANTVFSGTVSVTPVAGQSVTLGAAAATFSAANLILSQNVTLGSASASFGAAALTVVQDLYAWNFDAETLASGVIPTGWVVDAGSATYGSMISNPDGPTSDHVFQMHDTTTTAALSVKTTFSAITPSEIWIDARAAQTNMSASVLSADNAGTSSTTTVMQVDFGNDGHFKYYNAGWINLPTDTTYSANTWYTFRFVIDYTAAQATVYVNGVSKGVMPFIASTAPRNISRLKWNSKDTSYTENGTFMYNNIRVF